MNTTIATLQTQFREVTKEKDASLVSLRETLKAKDEDNARLQAKNEKIINELNKFQETLGSVQANAKSVVEQKVGEIKELKEQILAQGTGATEVQAKLNASQAQKTQLKSEVGKKAKEIETLQVTLVKNERVLAQYSKKLEDAEGKLSSAEEGAALLKMHLKSKSEMEKAAGAEVERLTIELSRAQKDLNEATEQCEKVLDATKKGHVSLTDSHKKEVERLESSIAEKVSIYARYRRTSPKLPYVTSLLPTSPPFVTS